jgi:hypothetical protein
MSYTTDDATRAMFQFHLDRGLSENQIMQPSGDGYDADDGYEFVHRGQNDEGEDAMNFSDGESGTVNIHDGEDDGEDADDDEDEDADDDEDEDADDDEDEDDEA